MSLSQYSYAHGIRYKRVTLHPHQLIPCVEAIFGGAEYTSAEAGAFFPIFAEVLLRSTVVEAGVGSELRSSVVEAAVGLGLLGPAGQLAFPRFDRSGLRLRALHQQRMGFASPPRLLERVVDGVFSRSDPAFRFVSFSRDVAVGDVFAHPAWAASAKVFELLPGTVRSG